MLVLTRKAKEEIRIGNDITVTIVRVKGQSVRIGINAPEHVHVMRSELVANSNDDSKGHDRHDTPGQRDSQNGAASNTNESSESSQRVRGSRAGNSGGTAEVDPLAADRSHKPCDHGDTSIPKTKAVQANEYDCRARHSPLGSTSTFARVVARQRRARVNQFSLLPPR